VGISNGIAQLWCFYSSCLGIKQCCCKSWYQNLGAKKIERAENQFYHCKIQCDFYVWLSLLPHWYFPAALISFSLTTWLFEDCCWSVTDNVDMFFTE
jgi:hypothetical protein